MTRLEVGDRVEVGQKGHPGSQYDVGTVVGFEEGTPCVLVQWDGAGCVWAEWPRNLRPAVSDG